MPDDLADFELHEPLGAGATATVCRATRRRDGRQVALKRISVDDPATAAVIASEHRMLARVDHPGIVRIIANGLDEGGRPWLAMELVPGRSLAEQWAASTADPSEPTFSLDAFGPDTNPSPAPRGAQRSTHEDPTGAEVLAPLVHLLEALSTLHGEGIVHRDVKPENVLHTPDGRTVLVDFGLATAASDGRRGHLNTVSLRAGTPRYMAPEQIRGEPLDARADLYAVGVMLYERLAGRPPFRAHDAAGWLHHHLHSEPAPLDLPVPGRILRTLNGLLAKRREERPGYAIEVAELLAELADLPTPTSGRPYLYPAPLVGRDAVLSRLVEVCTAGGRVALQGPPGSGRTRLLGEAVGAARRAGARVDVIPGGTDAPLATLASSLGVARDVSDPLVLAERICRALERTPPRAVAIDDLGQTDPMTRTFVDHVGRRGLQGAVGVVVVSEARGFETLHLRPLDRADTDALVRGMLGTPHHTPSFVDALHAHTRGNAGSVGAFLHAALEAGQLTRAAGQWTLAQDASVDGLALPASLEALARRRFATLDADAAVTLAALELLGRRAPSLRLEAVAGEAAEQGLPELVRRGLVEGTTERVLVDAALGRVALTEVDCRLLHARAAPGATGADRARHLAGAGRIDEAVQAWRDLASTHSRQERFEGAVRVLRRAVDLAPDRPVLQVELGTALTRAGRAVEAERVLTTALAGPLPPHQQALALLELATAHIQEGRDAEHLVRRAWQLDPSREERCLLTLACTLAQERRWDEALEVFAEARARVRDPELALRVRIELARAHGRRGRVDLAEPLLREAIPMAEAQGIASQVVQARAMLAYALIEREAHDEGLPHLRRAIERAHAEGDLCTQGLLLRNLGTALLTLSPHEARQHFEDALRRLRVVGHERYLASARTALGTGLVATGANRRAVEVLDPAVETYRGVGEHMDLVKALCTRARALAHLGEEDRVIADADEVRALLADVSDWRLDGFVAKLVEGLVDLGRLDEASDLAALMDPTNHPTDLAVRVHIARAQLGRARGDLEGAAVHLERARPTDRLLPRTAVLVDIEAAWQALARGEPAEVPPLDPPEFESELGTRLRALAEAIEQGRR